MSIFEKNKFMRQLILIIISVLLLCLNTKSQNLPIPFKTIGVFVVDSAGKPVYWKADFIYRIVKDTMLFVQDTVLINKDSSKANVQLSKKLIHDTSYFRPILTDVTVKGKKIPQLQWIPLNPAWLCPWNEDVDTFITQRKLKPFVETKK